MSETAPIEIQERIAKILAKASRAGTPAEAAAFAAKAQELLERYNLTAADVTEAGEAGFGSGRRTDEKHRGGHYDYERWVWRSVARLNFCLYFCHWTWVERSEAQQRLARVRAYADPHRRRYHRTSVHKIVGRTVNVAATRAMATYLLSAVERLTRERLQEQGFYRPSQPLNQQLRTRWATSFRRGAADAIVSRIEERRRVVLSEARTRERAAAAAGTAGVAQDTAVALLRYVDAETDANNDYLYGAGWSAARASERAERAAAARLAAEEHARWAAANPEEAARQAARDREEQRRRDRRRSLGGGRGSRGGDDGTDWSAFSAGARASQVIGLDPQANHSTAHTLRLT